MIVILIISFLLESLVTKLFLSNSILTPLFTLTSLVVIFPYFKYEKDYFKLCLILGFLYDIAYTNTLFVHCILFFIIGYITKILNYYISNNYINNSLMLIINIIIYRFLYYVIFTLSNNYTFSLNNLFKGIYSSLLINIIYISIVYYIIEKSLFKNKKYKI